MKAFLIVAALVTLSCRANAQATPDLTAYLKLHRYEIRLSDTNTFAMLPALMGRQNVLILGEGASHDLRLYDTLQQAVQRQLVRQNLRTVLIEWGHDLGYLYSRYLAGQLNLSATFVPSALLPYRPFVGQAGFRVAGIDFERAGPFYLAVSTVLSGIDTTHCIQSRGFIRMISDSTYIRYSEKEFNRFYKAAAAAFAANDSSLRHELGARYADLKYLCTNQNQTKRYEYRDPAMAKNFLREIAPFDSTATYFCEIGSAHSRTDNRGSMAALLNADPVLRGRIIVMNTYCDDCHTDEGPTKRAHNGMRSMKGMRLEAVREAALGDVTLFDLSGLAGADADLKEYGALLLFVRNHD